MKIWVVVALMLGMVGCVHREGPGERAGKKIDRAAEKIDDAARDTKRDFKKGD